MKTVFVDVDTQIDFLFPAGALYVPGGEYVVDAAARLNRFAAGRGSVVISTVDAHAEDDPEFKRWSPHCVVGTAGQQKPAATLLEKRISIPNAACELALDGHQQLLVEKQTLDCFTNVNLERALALLEAESYVVYGVVTEICVRFAALGLLKTRKRVELVADAVRNLDDRAAAETLKDFVAQGGVMTSVQAVTSRWADPRAHGAWTDADRVYRTRL